MLQKAAIKEPIDCEEYYINNSTKFVKTCNISLAHMLGFTNGHTSNHQLQIVNGNHLCTFLVHNHSVSGCKQTYNVCLKNKCTIFIRNEHCPFVVSFLFTLDGNVKTNYLPYKLINIAKWLTNFPLCGEDLVSLSEYTLPHTDTSLHTPGVASDWNPPLGLMISTPLVVSPSIPDSVFHLHAFSWAIEKKMTNFNELNHNFHYIPGPKEAFWKGGAGKKNGLHFQAEVLTFTWKAKKVFTPKGGGVLTHCTPPLWMCLDTFYTPLQIAHHYIPHLTTFI